MKKPIQHLSLSRATSQIEALESRIAPAAIIVTTLDDVVASDSVISLREAIAAANTDTAGNDAPAGSADGDIITFDPSLAAGTLAMDATLGEFAISDDLIIDGEAQSITIDAFGANGASRIFNIDASGGVGTGHAVSILDLDLVNGDTTGSAGEDGGAILITGAENVTLTRLDIAAGNATGLGGAIAVKSSTLVVNECAITGSTALTGGGGIAGLDSTITLNGVTLSGNAAIGGTIDKPGNGGGLFNDGTGTVTINAGGITGNGAVQDGGGIWNSATGTVNILPMFGFGGTLIDMNNADGDLMNGGVAAGTGGGGIHNLGTMNIVGASIESNVAAAIIAGNGGGGILNKGTMTLVDVTVNENSTADNVPADSGDGGGILNTAGGDLTILGGSFTTNSAARAGGAIENNGATLTIDVDLFGDGTSFDDNFADVNGGAIHQSGAGTTDITRAVFEDSGNGGNTAVNEGGSLWNSSTGAMTVTETSIADGSAKFGGGIHNDGGALTVSRSLLEGNEAAMSGGGLSLEGATGALNTRIIDSTITLNMTTSADGGGIAVLSAATGSGTIEIDNGTIAANTADDEGGGLYVADGTVTLVSTLLGDNDDIGGDNDVDRGAGATINADHSLIEAGAGAAINGTSTNNIFNTDAQLGSLADNGGQTETIAFAVTSAALSAGSNPLNLATDQRGTGFVRTVGIDTDIGAYEEQDVPLIANYAVASGKSDHVLVYDDATGVKIFDFKAFGGDKAVKGVTVATGDVDGDKIEDIVVGAGKGALGNTVKVFSGRTGLAINTIQAFATAFKGGVNVAVGDVTDPSGAGQDGFSEIVVGAGIGKLFGPAVKLFDKDGTELASLDPYPNAKTNPGVRVAVGDVNGDLFGDIVTAPMKSTFGANVKVFSGATGQQIDSFLAYSDPKIKGVFVATGDVNGDGIAEIITGNDAGAQANVKVFQIGKFFGVPRQVLANFTVFDPTYKGGVRVASVDADGDGDDDIIIGTGKAKVPTVQILNGQGAHAVIRTVPGLATDKDLLTGVFVG